MLLVIMIPLMANGHDGEVGYIADFS